MGSYTRQFKRRKGEHLKPRRVVLPRPGDVDDFGSRIDVPIDERAARFAAQDWHRDRTHAKKKRTATHPVVRLTEDGIDWGAAPGAGDLVGYCMDPLRSDSCFRAAIATCTQTPIEEVPDPEIDKRRYRGEDPEQISESVWEGVNSWARDRGLTLMLWGARADTCSRWIGVVMSRRDGVLTEIDSSGRMVRIEDAGSFNDHCLVMSYDRLLFDPSCSIRVPPGTRMLQCNPSQITYAVSFDKKE